MTFRPTESLPARRPLVAAGLAVAGLLVAGCAAGQSPPARATGPQAPAVQSPRPAAAPAPLDPAAASAPVSPAASSPATEEPIATVGDAQVSREALEAFLVQTRGLDALLNLMLLELARDEAERRGAALTDEDVAEEIRLTMQGAAPEAAEADYDRVLEELLARQQLTRAEFDVVMATNATLRKLAGPIIRQQLGEENLRRVFNVRYGEQVRVRHIALDNLAEVAQVQRRLAAGEEFAAVAAQVSREPQTAQFGGLLPPFGMQSGLPEAFKVAAFELEVGQTSDPVESEGFFHLIQLEERIAPRAVRFEDVRDELAEQVVEEQSQVLMTRLRRELSRQMAESIDIRDPHLRRQLDARLAAAQPQPMSPEEYRRRLESERPLTPTSPTSPATPATLTDPDVTPAEGEDRGVEAGRATGAAPEAPGDEP